MQPTTFNGGSIQEVAPDVRRLRAPNAGMMTGPGTNTYIVGSSRFVVIDPGPAIDAHIESILAATQMHIDSILVTHTHMDHSPAARAVGERSGAPVMGMTPPNDGRQDPSFAPARVLGDGDLIIVESRRLRAIHTPGHVSNHLCYLLEDSGLLFTGDHLNQGATVVIPPPDGSMRDYLNSLRRLQREPVAQIAPGHGNLIDNAPAEIERIYQHRLQRETKVLNRLANYKDGTTLDELLPSVYDDVHEVLHPVAKQSLLAHLIKLREDGRVLQTHENSWKQA